MGWDGSGSLAQFSSAIIYAVSADFRRRNAIYLDPGDGMGLGSSYLCSQVKSWLFYSPVQVLVMRL